MTVSTPAQVVSLTTLARVKAELGITVLTDDALFEALIAQAVDAVQTFCQRVFARQVYSESAPAYGGPYLTTRHAPVVVLHSASFNGQTLTDITIEDAGKGLLYRQAGFDWTAQRFGGMLAAGGLLNRGVPIPLTEEPLVALSYTAAFILPAQNLLDVATVSVQETDDSFNDSDGSFPALLKAGDIIASSGFTQATNNGRFVVTGTPTAAKVTVNASLTDEAADTGRSVLVSNLPGDVERGCIETVKTLFSQRRNDSSLVEMAAGSMRKRYSEGGASEPVGIPPTAIGLLRPWIRRVR